MKVILLYPPREHFVFGTTPHVHIEADSGYYPPIGLLYIAASLERSENITVKVIDAHTEQLDHNGVKEIIRAEQPDVLGIYFSSYYLFDPILAARNAKAVSPNTVVVAGGPHTSLFPFETAKLPEVDYVLCGEGEESFPKICEYIRSKNRAAIETIPGVVVKGASYNADLVRSKVENIDSLAFPARHLIDQRKYSSILAKKNPITTVITSRGCPFSCRFCSNIESGQKVRYRSAVNIVEELAVILERFDIRDFLFFDELFTSNRNRVFEICDEILSRGLKIRWHCRSRADVLDKQMAVAMKKAGCRLIQFGIETGSERLQKHINKNLPLQKVRETVNMAYDEGIYTYGDFMFGLPSETKAEAEETAAFASSLKLDYAIFGIFHYAPGSVFFNEYAPAAQPWRRYLEDPETGFIQGESPHNPDYTKEYLEDFSSRVYKRFYLNPRYVFRHVRRMDSIEQMVWQAKSSFNVFGRAFQLFKK